MEKQAGKFHTRNVFDLTFDNKLTCDMGQLIPISVQEAIPGDTWEMTTDCLLRLAPMLYPIMHRVNLYVHHFFVPNRLVWDNWQDFITGGSQGTDSPVPPTLLFADGHRHWVVTGDLADYMGLPSQLDATAQMQVSALPFRAYNKIFNDWFRDQTFIDERVINTGDGEDLTTDITIAQRAWEKDYFTSALPWTQRGDPVTIGIGGTAPVTINAGHVQANFGSDHGLANLMPGTTVLGQTPSVVGSAAVPEAGVRLSVDPGQATYDSQTGDVVAAGTFTGTADLSTATAITVNQLRQAIQVQRWLELNARAGARYIETILAHFGVRSSDARLQRSEYLGGGKSPITISEVLQTSSTDGTSPQGNMAGHGFSAQRSDTVKKSIEEHGFIISLLSIMPRTAYQQGVPRKFGNRNSRYDYYWPAFAHLGEQAVLNQEIYLNNTGTNTGTWGYVPRYEEYRRNTSEIHGDFRDSLDAWHMGRIFAAMPTLSEGFISSDPTQRIFAADEVAYRPCWVQLLNKIKVIRPIPKHGDPGLMDHL